jgi:hypothetical protein
MNFNRKFQIKYKIKILSFKKIVPNIKEELILRKKNNHNKSYLKDN